MNKKIQPEYNIATVTCSTCGNTFKVGSTKSDIKVDTCYNCHQFYTGAQSQAQATGRVEIFNKKFQAGEKAKKEMVKRTKAKEEREKQREEEKPKKVSKVIDINKKTSEPKKAVKKESVKKTEDKKEAASKSVKRDK